MDHVGVGEATEDVGDGRHLADVGQELVAQALPFVGPLDEPGDVHELHVGGHHGRNPLPLGEGPLQGVKPLVLQGHHPHVLVYGGEGVVGGEGVRPGEGVEEGGLAHVG